MRLAVAMVWCAAVQGQGPAALGYIHGKVTLCDVAAHEFGVRTLAGADVKFRYDARTWMEREHARAAASSLRTGELVEVVSERIAAEGPRYARTIHVVEPEAPPRPMSNGRYRALKEGAGWSETPRGNLTFTGVVKGIEGGELRLDERGGVQRRLTLRPDTLYVASGEVVEVKELKTGTRVFVRAGRSIWDEVEVYQVIWGGILQPGAK